jgi:hypothetical protein
VPLQASTRLTRTALVLTLSGTLGCALAQDFEKAPSTWQEHLDLQTSAAASSTVLHYRCAGPAAQEAALSATGRRLRDVLVALAPLGADARTAHGYAADAYRINVSALWQSTEGAPCSGLSRLRDLARYVGYPVPAATGR